MTVAHRWPSARPSSSRRICEGPGGASPRGAKTGVLASASPYPGRRPLNRAGDGWSKRVDHMAAGISGHAVTVRRDGEPRWRGAWSGLGVLGLAALVAVVVLL